MFFQLFPIERRQLGSLKGGELVNGRNIVYFVIVYYVVLIRLYFI